MYPSASDAQVNTANKIDLRSDTVTRPDDGMWQAIRSAELGDDVFGEDPSVNALEKKSATLSGKAAALFFPTGTQSNLAAMLSHCQRGEEVLVGQEYHTCKYEASGASVLGGVGLHHLPLDRFGHFAIDPMSAIKADDPHYPITRLLAMENTCNGCVIEQGKIDAWAEDAKANGLNVHLDGARIFNASIKTGNTIQTLLQSIDSASICLSKGLGTPAGSVLVGDIDFINRARRIRKILGGGMRQAGVLAAAGIYALDNNVERLAEDHQNAVEFAAGLADHPHLKIDGDLVQTNMVFVETEQADDLAQHLKNSGILIKIGHPAVRVVFHKDVPRSCMDQLISAFKEWQPG